MNKAVVPIKWRSLSPNQTKASVGCILVSYYLVTHRHHEFFCILSTQKALDKEKLFNWVERLVKPVWVILRPIPSPITKLYGLSHIFLLDTQVIKIKGHMMRAS